MRIAVFHMIVWTMMTCSGWAAECEPGATFRIIINKSDYRLSLFDITEEDRPIWCVTYPVVFGFAKLMDGTTYDISDKMFEGDGRTPNGKFKILTKEVREGPKWKNAKEKGVPMNKEWIRFMLLDYPNETSKATGLNNQRKNVGKGGGIAIHGTYPDYLMKGVKMQLPFGDSYVMDGSIHNKSNWTNGCISLKINDIKELYDLISVGTEVIIQP
jgi:lipoprotein-anchoring transpeptidase ErfK/SrfK